ncbi:MAG: hypothetical protein AB8W37_05005 [Arsenophonus endosymbiont of Dermacentor nuttalli]
MYSVLLHIRKKSFNIDIINDLTIKPQQLSIGDYVATCSPENKIKGRIITYSTPAKSNKFSTNLDGLSYNLDVNNSATLDENAKANIKVHGLFKLDYNDQDWLYGSNVRVTIPD